MPQAMSMSSSPIRQGVSEQHYRPLPAGLGPSPGHPGGEAGGARPVSRDSFAAALWQLRRACPGGVQECLYMERGVEVVYGAAAALSVALQHGTLPGPRLRLWPDGDLLVCAPLHRLAHQPHPQVQVLQLCAPHWLRAHAHLRVAWHGHAQEVPHQHRDRRVSAACVMSCDGGCVVRGGESMGALPHLWLQGRQGTIAPACHLAWKGRPNLTAREVATASRI